MGPGQCDTGHGSWQTQSLYVGALKPSRPQIQAAQALYAQIAQQRQSGHEGRRFAVVAAEVRALAHRSTKAAQQIRDLIHESTRQVSEGTVTVDAAANTIRKAVESVHLVTQRLGEITSATREESKEVSDIGDAMQVLDEVTRQNASLVQESTLACEALTGRADTLQRAVQIFSVTIR